MKIPEEILYEFEKEIDNLKYGKAYLEIIKRGKHIHFEINKNYTIFVENDDVSEEINENN